MKVLLTGGAGFIGSHIAEEYHRRDYEVVIVDNFSSGAKENISKILGRDGVYLYETDIRNREEMERIIKKHRPDIINHHAAQKSVAHSIDDPYYDASINIIGLINLLTLTKKYQIKNFIYVSSGGALATKIIDGNKSKETDTPQLESPYAITKYAGEQYVRLYAKMHQFEYSILRYGNVYGPRQIACGECGVIPIFLENILTGKKCELMTYEDMPRGCSRDYIFISDVVNINLIVTERALNQVVNISTSEEIYILDIYEIIKEHTLTSMPIEIQGPRLGDVRRSVLDISRVKRLTDWKPTISLEEGINILCEYYKDQMVLLRSSQLEEKQYKLL